MRRLLALVLTVAAMCAACTAGSDEPKTTTSRAVTFESLKLEWPKAQGKLQPAELPTAPKGFDAATLDRMAEILTRWAAVTVVDEEGWHSADPLAEVKKVLPKDAAGTLQKQVKGEVSPHLAVGNVFRHDVTVVGSPMVTSAWRITTEKDAADKRFMRLELQTRAAYEVRLGNADTRVIGVLRVQGLSAYPDTTDNFGVSGGWQEFGAGDCDLALDDTFVPDSDRAESLKDLKTFIRVGDSDSVEMPDLPVQDKVDAEYLKRCRDGRV